jgi:ferritin
MGKWTWQENMISNINQFLTFIMKKGKHILMKSIKDSNQEFKSISIQDPNGG